MFDVLTLWVVIWLAVTATFLVTYTAFSCAYLLTSGERRFGLFAENLQLALEEVEYADRRPSRLARLQTR